jgi:pilus assembly protein CpaD
MPSKPGDWRRRTNALLGGGALLALTTLSAGCSSTGTSDYDPAFFDHRQRHPILISEEPENFNLHVGMNGPALSPEIETALRDYVREYREHGTGSIAIQVPTGSANEIAAGKTGRAIHYALVRAGVPNSRIDIAPYYVGDHTKVSPLRVSYLRVKAVTPGCGVWPDGSVALPRNSQHHNFGCAAQHNLAAMVANPADLVRPRALDPASGKRRAMVITVYGEGGDPQSDIELIESDVEG